MPVLIFHATNDRNVGVTQSKLMGSHPCGQHELVIFDDLDHQLENSAARAKMLRKSDTFLRGP